MGTALEKYKQKMAQAADQYAGEERVGGSFISTRGGVLTYGEEALPGNEMLVVVLDAVHENTYYPERFDAEVNLPPKCFAFGRDEREMEAHENVPDPDDEDADRSYFELQSDTGFCSDCPWSVWGSADKGKGKACSNRRRLALIPAGRFVEVGKGRKKETEMEVFEEPEHFRDADIAFMKLPVTSVKNWSKYVHQLRKEFERPPFGVLTHIYIEPDPKTQFKIHFDFIEVIEDEDILEVVLARHEEAADMIIQPYEEPSADDLERPKAKAQKGLSSLKKKKQARR